MPYEDEKVYQVDYSQPPEEIKRQEDANAAAKLRHAARREQERFDAPTMMDKFRAGIAKLKLMLSRKKQIQQSQQNNNQTTR